MASHAHDTIPAWTWALPAAASVLLALKYVALVPADHGFVLALAGLLLGGSVFAAVHHAEVLALKLGEPFGSILLGSGIVLCWCFTANALLDNSKPEFRPVEIVEFWSTTHSFLFREYEIEYRFPGEQKTRKLLSTPARMSQFRFKAGVAEVHAGRFGWSWVKDVTPLRASQSGQRSD